MSVAGVREPFRARLSELGGHGSVVVAFSGGLDSSVLLHLARFARAADAPRPVAAHLDHGMRSSSAGDARWVAGICRAWDVPLRAARLGEAPSSEEEARDARYRFLESVRRDVGAELVLTAHHADDQAETVLFRLLRGSGSRGLSGIPAHRGPAVARPLLDLWRADLEAYAREVLLGWREDPTNLDPSFARNALRSTILPDVERLVSPGARRALVRLADLAGEEEAAWESVLPDLVRPLDPAEVEGGLTFLRAPFLDLHRGVRMRVLRSFARRLGRNLDHAATRRAIRFAESSQSGRAIDLAGALTLGVDLERVALVGPTSLAAERPLTIDDAGPGRGTAVLGGSPVQVVWGGQELPRSRAAQGFDPGALRFPLLVRSRRPGDRIRLAAGTKKVKKVLLEYRIPPSRRDAVPLLVDAEGDVLWIPGLAMAERGVLSDVPGALRIGIG